jgi:hypothetical protein
MVTNAIFAATVVTLALFFLLARELEFLAPYRWLLIHQYGSRILLFFAILFFNLMAAALALGRRFFLKDTGRKLAHFDRELNAGRTDMPPHLHREELN